MAPSLLYRPEAPADAAGLRAVHEAAFGGPAEADLVDALRANGHSLVSWVAFDPAERRLVGHVLFSPVVLKSSEGDRHGAGLAPLAVLPAWQRRGVGTALGERGMEGCRRLGLPWVVLLGHVGYYGRFGFVPASRFGVTSAWGGRDEFQLAELIPGAIPAAGGLAEFSPEFGMFG